MDLSAPLFRLKLLIWIHSTIGAALVLGLLKIALFGGRTPVAIGLLLCLLPWMIGFGPLGRRADALAPEDRVPPKGLPLWIVPLLAVGAFLSPFSLMSPLGWMPAGASLLLAGTIAIRRVVCVNLDIPVHESWGWILHVLALGLLWNAVLLILFVMSRCG